MILYDYFRSSAAFRVRIAMNLKGLKPERRFIHLRKGEQRNPEYLAINPQGLIPTLFDGEACITQSLAIIEYLDEKYPEPPLLPESATDRAWVRAIALSIACDIHPLDNTRVLKYLSHTLQADEKTRDQWYEHWIREGFNALEVQLAGRASGRLCLGDSPTVADVFLVPQVANATRMKIALDDWPRIRSINEACLQIPAFVEAQPAQQPDAE